MKKLIALFLVTLFLLGSMAMIGCEADPPEGFEDIDPVTDDIRGDDDVLE
jgi:hypothetical protein